MHTSFSPPGPQPSKMVINPFNRRILVRPAGLHHSPTRRRMRRSWIGHERQCACSPCCHHCTGSWWFPIPDSFRSSCAQPIMNERSRLAGLVDSIRRAKVVEAIMGILARICRLRHSSVFGRKPAAFTTNSVGTRLNTTHQDLAGLFKRRSRRDGNSVRHEPA